MMPGSTYVHIRVDGLWYNETISYQQKLTISLGSIYIYVNLLLVAIELCWLLKVFILCKI